jgi:predicted nucleic acid-binding protein
MAEGRLIICNTSPLINLAEINRLDLLENLSGKVCLPPAVREELRAKSGLFPNAATAAEAGNFATVAPTDALLVRNFAATLHRGEAECLALAMENPRALLILDDLSARAVASANQLPFTGTLGILSVAKSMGHVEALAPLLRDLRLRARFWINPRLEQTILEEAGEAD